MCPRRILGLKDHGPDVALVQHALNELLYLPRDPLAPDWRSLSKEVCPMLWGYEWAPGALQQNHYSTHLRTRVTARIQACPPRAALLKEDSQFGPKTEEAVLKFQRKMGIPDDGIVGPETWETLIPLWKVIVWMPKPKGQPGLPAPASPTVNDKPVADPGKPLLGSPFRPTEIDNVEYQTGVQRDKDGLSNVLVMQATWKTERAPREIVPGHWEHTGGCQVVSPVDGPGKNIQCYYQLTRAELLSVDVFEGVKLTLVAPFAQPYVQAPLDGGSSDNPNRPKAGIQVGNTVSLEIQPDKDGPTVKLFVQGAATPASVDSGGKFEGISVSPRGKVDVPVAIFGGVSIQYDWEYLGKWYQPKQNKPAAPPETLEVEVSPQPLVIARGQTESIKIKFTPPLKGSPWFNLGGEAAFSGLQLLTPSVSMETGPMSATATLKIQAGPNAGAGQLSPTLSWTTLDTKIAGQVKIKVQIQ